MELVAGAVVAGRYRLDRQLGKGGMGEVWAATQTLTRMPVALKFLRDPAASEDVRRRFLREARAACAVRHPNVVQIHDVVELPGGEPVMVMELLVGESLEQRLRREGKIALRDAAAILLRVVSAVGTAHQLGIVHRDLKPDNIFLAETREGVEVKVVDFGIAKLTAAEGDAAETAGLTGTGAMLGTPYYMSPEQAFGERAIDHRADIWSLGVILYRCLTGVLPTQAENIGQILKIIMTNAIRPLGEIDPALPPDVVALVGRMLTQDRARRPQDLREVKALLERHAGVSVETFGAPAAAPDAAGVQTSAGVSVMGASGAEPTIAAATGARRTQLTVAISLIAVALGAAAIFAKPRAKPRVEPAALTAMPATIEAVRASSTAAEVVPAGPAPTASASAPPSATVPPLPSGKKVVRGPTAPTATAALTSRPSLGGVIEKPPF